MIFNMEQKADIACIHGGKKSSISPKRIFYIYLIIVFLTPVICLGQRNFPEDKLPSHISQLTTCGQRAEWSLNGKKVFFIDSAGGDVWSVDVLRREFYKITKPEDSLPDHLYYGVFVMWNGDLLMGHGCGLYIFDFVKYRKNRRGF